MIIELRKKRLPDTGMTFVSCRTYRDAQGQVQVTMKPSVWDMALNWREHKQSLWEIAESFFKPILPHSTQTEGDTI